MVRVFKFVLGSIVAVALVLAFAVFVLDIHPWQAKADQPKQHSAPRQPTPIKLVGPYTVEIPEEVRRALGIRQHGQEGVVQAKLPTHKRELVIPGSTALDPDRLMRIRRRFAPAQVVSLAEVDEPLKTPSVPPEKRELRMGDKVTPGMTLGTFFSADVGNKKNDLFEAIVQKRLDEVILDKAEKARGSLPDIYLWTARRNLDTDRSAERRARNTLLTWGVDQTDIDAVEKEAKQLDIAEGRRQEMPEAEWTRKHDEWAKVVLKAPDFKTTNPKMSDTAVVIERNVNKGELVVDNTVNLLTVARVDQLIVQVNCPEDDLPELYRLPGTRRKWTIHTVGADPKKGLKGTITEIGQIIDPNQHTAFVKGYIPNPDGKIRAGQFATATVELLMPDDVVEIPMDALVEDGRQSVVFVQTDAAKQQYTMRRVEVVSRYEKSVFIRSKAVPKQEPVTEEEKKEAEEERKKEEEERKEELKQGLLPKELLTEKDKVLAVGALELKAKVLEMEASRNEK